MLGDWRGFGYVGGDFLILAFQKYADKKSMADYKRKKRRKHKRSSSSRPHKRRSTAEREMRIEKKHDFPFFPYLFLTAAMLVVVAFYLLQDRKKPSSESGSLHQPVTNFTVEERIKKKNIGLKLEQEIHLQKMLSEKFKKPVEGIDPVEPELSPLDMGIRFSEDTPIKEVFKELAEHPFENDVYEDPEDVVRRQLAHHEWIEQHLEERNEQEKREFIKYFVKTARKQGYKVHFTKDMQVILEPIDPEDENKEANFEKVQINWK